MDRRVGWGGAGGVFVTGDCLRHWLIFWGKVGEGGVDGNAGGDAATGFCIRFQWEARIGDGGVGCGGVIRINPLKRGAVSYHTLLAESGESYSVLMLSCFHHQLIICLVTSFHMMETKCHICGLHWMILLRKGLTTRPPEVKKKKSEY